MQGDTEEAGNWGQDCPETADTPPTHTPHVTLKVLGLR